jgi:hypothetical protein
MGYDLHITRGEYWAENHGHHISREEWLALVEADTELTLDSRSGPCFARWSGPGKNDDRWFDWLEGNISTKYPDRMMLKKMLQIADILGAKVQGDDGEIYMSVSDFPEFTPADQTQLRDNSSIPAYLRREVRFNYIVYGLIVLAIVAINFWGLW